MNITNKTGKIIAIGELVLLPGDTEILPKDFVENPVIKFFAETGRVELFENEAEAEAPAPHVPAEEQSHQADDVEQMIAAVKEMRRAELDALAEELGIAIEEGDTVPTLKEKLIAYYQRQSAEENA